MKPGITRRPRVFITSAPATTGIYPLSLHDALPIWLYVDVSELAHKAGQTGIQRLVRETLRALLRSEEHTSELQSPVHLVCRLLLEKKNSVLVPSAIRMMPGMAPPIAVAAWL